MGKIAGEPYVEGLTTESGFFLNAHVDWKDRVYVTCTKRNGSKNKPSTQIFRPNTLAISLRCFGQNRFDIANGIDGLAFQASVNSWDPKHIRELESMSEKFRIKIEVNGLSDLLLKLTTDIQSSGYSIEARMKSNNLFLIQKYGGEPLVPSITKKYLPHIQQSYGSVIRAFEEIPIEVGKNAKTKLRQTRADPTLFFGTLIEGREELLELAHQSPRWSLNRVNELDCMILNMLTDRNSISIATSQPRAFRHL